jgi:hypothetical protein
MSANDVVVFRGNLVWATQYYALEISIENTTHQKPSY